MCMGGSSGGYAYQTQPASSDEQTKQKQAQDRKRVESDYGGRESTADRWYSGNNPNLLRESGRRDGDRNGKNGGGGSSSSGGGFGTDSSTGGGAFGNGGQGFA